jgi:hypothetical protein
VKAKQKYSKFLDDLVGEYCPSNHYCLLKEYLITLQSNPRILLQLKCLEKYKYELSTQQQKEISWDEALVIWIEKGYAAKFSELYLISPDIPFSQFYSKLINP